jgi:hypothetical protein
VILVRLLAAQEVELAGAVPDRRVDRMRGHQDAGALERVRRVEARDIEVAPVRVMKPIGGGHDLLPEPEGEKA